MKLMGYEWPAITATIQLVLEPFDDLGWEAEADFVLDDGLAFALLGYEGFLNRWAVSFNGGFGYFIVQPADDFHEALPPETLAQLRVEWPDLFP